MDSDVSSLLAVLTVGAFLDGGKARYAARPPDPSAGPSRIFLLIPQFAVAVRTLQHCRSLLEAVLSMQLYLAPRSRHSVQFVDRE